MDERQRRLLLGGGGRPALGRGGVKAVASVTGAHPATVARGAREASGAPEPRTRAAGRRPQAADRDRPGAGPRKMDTLVSSRNRGGIRNRRCRWTCLSTRNLADTLTAAGHRCSAPTAARLLKSEGYSLQGNAKVRRAAGSTRTADAQFRYIARTAREHLDAGQPVVSVDAKKKEKVRRARQRRRRVAAEGPPGAGQRARLPLPTPIGKADPVWHLRSRRQCRMPVSGRHGPRHLRVRRGGRCAAWSAGRRPSALATRKPVRLLEQPIRADSGGSNAPPGPAHPEGGLARLAAETGAPEITWAPTTTLARHAPSGTSRRAPAFRADHPQLARPAADQPPGRRSS